jgi:acyl-coenzyme A thioesterase PaaI-like protein
MPTKMDALSKSSRSARALRPIDPFPAHQAPCTFVSGDQDDSRLRVQYFYREADGAVVARVRFGSRTQGARGYAHGGSIAAVLDEVLGAVAWQQGHPVVSAHLSVRFAHRLRLPSLAVAEARVLRKRGRKMEIRGTIRDRRGRMIAAASGLFVVRTDAAQRSRD